jgi:hypothetical protein
MILGISEILRGNSMSDTTNVSQTSNDSEENQTSSPGALSRRQLISGMAGLLAGAELAQAQQQQPKAKIQAKKSDLEVVEGILNRRRDGDNILTRGSLKNRRIGNACTGYSVGIDSLSYRGVWVSTIEDIVLKVDGEVVPKDDILFCVNNKRFLIANLKTLSEEFWYALDPGVITVNKVGGLAPGEHEIEITLSKRADFGHSYENYKDAKEFYPVARTDRAKFTIAKEG